MQWGARKIKEDQPGCLIFGHVERVQATSNLKACPDKVYFLSWYFQTPLFFAGRLPTYVCFFLQLVQHLVLVRGPVAFSTAYHFFTEFSQSHLNPMKGTPLNRQNWAAPEVREVTLFMFFSNPLFHQCLQHNMCIYVFVYMCIYIYIHIHMYIF